MGDTAEYSGELIISSLGSLLDNAGDDSGELAISKVITGPVYRAVLTSVLTLLLDSSPGHLRPGALFLALICSW